MPFQFAAFLRADGVLIFSRQFFQISREQVVDLVATFFHLYTEKERKFTMLEEKIYRGIIRPMEEVILLLCSERSDNIVDDLEAAQLLSNVCRHICPEMKLQTIEQSIFALLVAMDEVFFEGQLSSNTLEEVLEKLRMVSENEVLADMNREGKVRSAIAIGQEKAKLLQQKKVNKTLAAETPISANYDENEISASCPTNELSEGNLFSADDIDTIEELLQIDEKYPTIEKDKSCHDEHEKNLRSDIQIYIVEKVSAHIFIKGGYKNFRLDGVLKLQARDYELSEGQGFRLNGFSGNDLDFHVSAEMNRPRFYQENFLTPKSTGIHLKEDIIDVLRWSSKQKDIHLPLPVVLSLWPRRKSMVLEFQAAENYPISSLCMKIPYCNMKLSSVHVDIGKSEVNETGGYIHWVIDDASEGFMRVEFDEDFVEAKVLPVHIEFQSPKTISGVKPEIKGNAFLFDCHISTSSGEYLLTS